MGNDTRSRFTRGKAPAENGKERLRLILTLDRTSLSPRLVETLKNDIRTVFSRYLVIDEDHLEVGLENLSGRIALVITIPVVMVRRNTFSA